MQNHFKNSIYFGQNYNLTKSSMHLEQIRNKLATSENNQSVFIPSCWVGESSPKPLKIDYSTFLLNRIEQIQIQSKVGQIDKNENWSQQAVIYNLFVRYCTAYDHNHDDIIGQHTGDITLNDKGIRETGTFLKTIAILPYLKSLGINTIHLLPITKIGIEGRKGDLGSPYAIKNPFEIDPLLADPIVNLPIEEQYKALVEAAHLLGMRVVQEFIFRTASIDSDWSAKNPEWFYWIKNDAKYGPPKFSKTELAEILKVPKGKGRHIPPALTYQKSFKNPLPGIAPKNAKIASAFADWPPDDLQPPWTDVTYLRLYNYDHQKENNYNYIAYNTIRYYDPKLAKKAHINHELWKRIAGIIPHYQKKFGIDGAMIDMGHALPNELKGKIIHDARELDSSFAFWDENFDNKRETKQDGYNAVIGDDWYRITKRQGFKKIIENSLIKKPLAQFGAAETHNSPRFGFDQIQKKKAAWLLFNVLPNAIPFMHNGYELNEQLPVNTGLNFTQQQIRQLSTQHLPLFFKNAMNWNTESAIIPFIQIIARTRSAHPWIFSGKHLSILKTDNPKVLGFEIRNRSKQAMILFNTNFHNKEAFNSNDRNNYYDPINEKNMVFNEQNVLKKGDFVLAISNS